MLDEAVRVSSQRRRMAWRLWSVAALSKLFASLLALLSLRRSRPLGLLAPRLRRQRGSGGAQALRCDACGQPLGCAGVDKLTGLLDRWGWDERASAALTQAADTAQPAALLLIDLDRFKQVNDTLGHPAGDEFLRAAAAVIRAELREGDPAGRYGGHGGDEFLAFLRGADAVAAATVAERIRAGISALQLRVATTRVSTAVITDRSASIGVAAHSPAVDVSLHDLVLQADLALRHAKAGGRDRIYVMTDSASRVHGVTMANG
ncbi:GGDEF domain-containing protein [Actinoplanes sp. NEAU-A12]|uniref:GGDEF domain-containing protein n=1 Tax=Actinoplanes sandaracinus TaxID=3045177 RepID=A0ABT6WHU0_9ACTN|nr:GGDEF domain-containing protein [Actinoplanes sandaracinus]MDI6099286.1 GGDEF domain-containing protein [Actinoplanes sandaracinus]